jgi:hypothetical protein
MKYSAVNKPETERERQVKITDKSVFMGFSSFGHFQINKSFYNHLVAFSSMDQGSSDSSKALS